ncbi:MAG: hypothetical protein ACXU8U_07620 [Asticcacaulis sp.]
MPKAAYKLPVVSYSLSGFAALRDTILYVPIWVVVFIAISVVYTVFFNLVSNYHAGQILINLRHYAQFDFANLSDANSLDYILQLKDIFELALPIALAYFTVIPIAVVRSRLKKADGVTAHIGFGQSELIVALNTLISYIPPLLFILFLSVLLHVLTDAIAPSPFTAEPGTTQTAAQAAAENPVRQLFSWLTMILSVPVFLFTYVRTSLSLPFSIEENRLGVLFSWRATRRLFWPILQVEALATLWAVLACGVVYGLFVVAYKFLFEKVYYIRYSVTFDGEMNAQWFFNLLALSVIYILFLILTFGPIVTLYRALRPAEDADDEDEYEDEAGDEAAEPDDGGVPA